MLNKPPVPTMTESEAEFQRGERVYLGRSRSSDNEFLHLERYRFALGLVEHDHTVLDAASGSGYGTEILAEKAASVVGIDISQHALNYASTRHMRPNIVFHSADLNGPLPMPDSCFDLIVSFETLEHVRNQANLISEFRRVLKPRGHLILSTPDRDVRTFRNRFHINELTRAQLLALVAERFNIQALYGQSTYTSSAPQLLLRLIGWMDVFGLHNTPLARLGLIQSVRRYANPGSAADSARILQIRPEDRRSHVFLIVVASVP